MLRGSRRGMVVVAVALLGSQLGHLVAYQLRYGAQAGHLESTGVHAYLPGLLTVLGALGSAGLIGCLLVIAVSRLLSAQASGLRARPQVSFVDLLAMLFALQLSVFLLQEMIEALAAGGAMTDPVTLVLLGTAGQLPIAIVGALVLGWLFVRFETALCTIIEAARRPARVFGLRRLSLIAPVAVDRARLLTQTCPHTDGKRGPPALRLVLN